MASRRKNVRRHFFSPPNARISSATWRSLTSRGKNKVPRLVNDRHVAEEILAFGGEKK